MAGKVDPVEDIDVINFELALADITQIEKRLERIAKGRAKTKEEIASNEVLLSFACCCNWQMYLVGAVKIFLCICVVILWQKRSLTGCSSPCPVAATGSSLLWESPSTAR